MQAGKGLMNKNYNIFTAGNINGGKNKIFNKLCDKR